MRAGWMVTLPLVIAACGPTTYPVDLFPEMHYQSSPRRLEPERLPPVADSVPTGGALARLSFQDAGPLRPPRTLSDAPPERISDLMRINCAMCHGPGGHGDGPVAPYFTPVRPVDFRSERVRQRTDGQLFWLVANGIGNMPPFRSLLSEDDLWLAVKAIRQTQ